MTRTTTFALFIIMLLYSWGSGDWYTNTEMHLRKNANKQKTKVSQGKREKRVHVIKTTFEAIVPISVSR